MRYRLRTLLTAMIVVGALAMGVRWWLRPYVLRGSYSNGSPAWEQWERRKVGSGVEHLATTRYWPNGQKAFEIHRINNVKRYWSSDGTPIDEVMFYQQRDVDEVLRQSKDSDNDRPWPHNLKWKSK